MVTESPYYPTFACNGLSSQSHLDQPRDKTWQHVRKPDTEGKGDSPWFYAKRLVMRMLTSNQVSL